MKKINKVIIASIITIMSIVFICVNIFWIDYNNSYKSLISGYENLEKFYMKKIDDYTLTIKPPRYLSFVGNFAISDLDTSLLIWPDINEKGNSKFGLIIYDEELNHGYRFYVDSDLNYIDEGNSEFDEEEVMKIKKLLSKYSNKLKQMKVIAFKEWNL